MSKAPKQSYYCMNCDWEIKSTDSHFDGIKCPNCDGPVMTGERGVILDNKVEVIQKQLIELGKEVAELHSTTHFPEWLLLKIGTSLIEGYPFNIKHWEDRIRPGISAKSN